MNDINNKEKIILHVDVNNAFLSWTAVDMLRCGENIDIRQIPSVIGGDEKTRSGIVLAKSNKAKILGIKTGDTIYQTRLKCPSIKVYLPSKEIYQEFSNKLYNILCRYSDKVERYSIDECFLDMTNCLMKKSILDIAKNINKTVKEELGFTVNIGIAPNKVLAKMASDFEKPDKIHTLYLNEIQEKLWILPVSELLMLGKKSVPKLNNMGIKTIGQLANSNKYLLENKFGKHGILMWEYSNGIDESTVKYIKEDPKCISRSTTFPYDISDILELEKILYKLLEECAYNLRKKNLIASVVAVQLRNSNFVDEVHQMQLDFATSSTNIIYNKAKEILKNMFNKSMKIRLIGIRLDKLTSKEETQISMFENKEKEKQEKIDKVLDNINEKYGIKNGNIITRAKAKE